MNLSHTSNGGRVLTAGNVIIYDDIVHTTVVFKKTQNIEWSTYPQVDLALDEKGELVACRMYKRHGYFLRMYERFRAWVANEEPRFR